MLSILRRVADELPGGDIDEAIQALRGVDYLLRGTSGLRCLLDGDLPDDSTGAGGSAASRGGTAVAVRQVTDLIDARIADLEGQLDQAALELPPEQTETRNAAIINLKDAWWAIARDRLNAAAGVADLLNGRPASDVANLDGWWAIQVALASLDRLEVRGRDSAGVHVLVSGPAAAGGDGGDEDPLFGSGSLRTADGCLSFVYKAAAEIGELGDNVRVLRDEIRQDKRLAEALEAPGALVTVLAHTRWASVGIISEPNAHPLNSDELGATDRPYVAAALNGDVDNHVALRLEEALSVPAEITTDAKVIPTIVSRRLAEGHNMDEAFRETVARFEGSVAIAASAAVTPNQLHLALRGSGQSLYVGLAEDAFVVASEPYGLVEETDRYVRMDGETTRGQVVTLTREAAGTLEGLTRFRYDGAPLPLGAQEVETAEITTRDVDRRGFDHFLLKELTEAPASFRKTLRGRIVPAADGGLAVRVGSESIPSALADAVARGVIRRVIVVGQGTAAVAGQAVASAVAMCLPEVSVSAMPATELSGFGLSDDMSDTLVVAISQSGTTTDTNRTVDLARSRGAHVVAVVNRRNSDLAAKSHGVFHTADGRDVEMSVASTKAFYSQVAAGWLLAAGLAQLSGKAAPLDLPRILAALRELPDAMEEVLSKQEDIGRIAASVAPPRRYWAVVGSGPDKIAAHEVRIKLSELCYRSISADATEDKKHIDLSCEPLIFVCAAGLRGANADDVAKEVAIYRAHKAAPVVVATKGEAERFEHSAIDVVTVPETEPAVGFVLSAMVGHLFGYRAALAIDAQARPLRAARAAIERASHGDPVLLLERLRSELEAAAAPFFAGLRDGSYNGNLEASTAVRLVSLLSYATGALPLESYESETDRIGTPDALLTDLLTALSDGIDELTRPIDAIKHQAKTVTVGISRSEDALLGVSLVKATLSAGPAPDMLGYRALRTLAALDPAVAEVLGYTRYRIGWTPAPTIVVLEQGGVARDIPSRTSSDSRLLGTKRRAAEEREVTVARGARDGRTLILIPEAHRKQVTGMTLLHVRFHEDLPASVVSQVLSGYRTRWAALRDAVTEIDPTFDESRLAEIPVVDLLTQPVYALAQRWRS